MTDRVATVDVQSFKQQADHGFSMIPLDGKNAFEKGWNKWCQKPRIFDENDFRGHNAGVCCGPASRVLVFDVDNVEAFDVLSKANGWSIPETYTVRTGKGYHYYLEYPVDGKSYKNRSIKHPVYSKHTVFDVRGDGGYVVAAGSVHPATGKLYEVTSDKEVAPIPEWLREILDGSKPDLDCLWDVPLPFPMDMEFVDSLKVSDDIKGLILEGKPKGERSNAGMSVLLGLLRASCDDRLVRYVFKHYPIGEKAREQGDPWLDGEIERAKQHLKEEGVQGRPASSSDLIYTEEQRGAIEELNASHASIMMGGKFAIMNEVIDPVFGRHDLTFSSLTDFKQRYGNRIVDNPYGNKPSQISIADLWYRSLDRRQYEGIVFSPGKDVNGYYNLYRGLAVEPKQGDWTLFKDHIHEVIADGNQEASDYIIAWMAHIVQHPGGKRPGTSIALRGKQGTGKGVFVSEFGKLFGNHFLQITNQQQITGRFNNHLKDALLVFCDEGIWGGNKTQEGVLKGMLTEDQIMVEPKGKDPFPVRNHIRMIVASNNDWIVPAGNMDRRFFVLDVSDKHMQDKEYFGPIVKQMDNGGREAMLYDLLEMDLTGIDLRKFPHTEARLDQIISSMAPVQKFWLDTLREGTLDKLDAGEWKGKVETERLLQRYVEYAKTLGERYLTTSTQFGKELRKYCPSMIRDRRLVEHPYEKKRAYFYLFPNLEECRKQFEHFIGTEMNWD